MKLKFGEYKPDVIVNLMGLTLLCDGLVEELFYFRKYKKVSQNLEDNCKRAIAEFDSLKWPNNEIKTLVANSSFNSVYVIESLYEFLSDYYKKDKQDNLIILNQVIGDLKCVVVGNNLDLRVKKAEELQKLFDDMGDWMIYNQRIVERN